GHNEGDEPSFTQPVMYAKIQEHPSLSEVYTEQLLIRGDLTAEEHESITEEFHSRLEKAQEEVKASPRQGGMRGHQGRWRSLSPVYSHASVPTGVPFETLQKIAEKLARLP